LIAPEMLPATTNRSIALVVSSVVASPAMNGTRVAASNAVGPQAKRCQFVGLGPRRK
jgi:hypothetical protein